MRENSKQANGRSSRSKRSIRYPDRSGDLNYLNGLNDLNNGMKSGWKRGLFQQSEDLIDARFRFCRDRAQMNFRRERRFVFAVDAREVF